MRRRPLIRCSSSTRRVGGSVGTNPGATSDLLVQFYGSDFFLRGYRECIAGPGHLHSPAESHELLHRALQGAIDQVTERFEEAQSEYQLVTPNSRDGYKWKGQMIAYANVVALLEDLKSRPVLAQ
jgi:hypothetical protein